MKHQLLLKCLGILSLAHMITAREFRTPIPLLRYMLLHTEPLVPSEEKSQLYAWGGYYQRKADTYRCDGANEIASNSKKCPLSALLFGQANFSVNDIFATQDSSPINILFSTILSPRVKYTDRGALFGFTGSYAVDCNVVVGARVAIPFRNFNMELTQGPIVNNQIDPTILAANVREQTEVLLPGSNPVDTFAYRLDFLSELPVSWNGDGFHEHLVVYSATPPNFPGNPIAIANIDVTDSAGLNTQNRNPVTVIKRTDSSAPTAPFAIPLTEAQTLSALPEDGEGVVNNERRRFVSDTNYAPLGDDPTEQSTFWVEPSFTTQNDITRLVAPACEIKRAVDDLIGSPATAISEILASNGITFASQKHGGLGDIDAQFFTQYWWNTCSFFEGNIALRLPTAGTQMATGKLLLQPLGNNGHPELMFGARAYWHDYDWLLLQADALYSVVLKRTEIIAIPYQGATVKNIGNQIPAHINWQYFWGHLEAGYYHTISCNNYAIARFGYELYSKSKDNISLESDGCTCLPVSITNMLNVNNVRANTHSTAHKLYGEISLHYQFSCLTAGLFASVGGVVGGKNTPQEIEWYLGLEFVI